MFLEFNIKFFSVFDTIRTFIKGGRPANKFRKSQIRKFADFKKLLDLQTFRKCVTFRIFGPNLFNDLGTENFRKSANTHHFSTQI